MDIMLVLQYSSFSLLCDPWFSLDGIAWMDQESLAGLESENTRFTSTLRSNNIQMYLHKNCFEATVQ